jgi:flagellar biosynthesis protein
VGNPGEIRFKRAVALKYDSGKDNAPRVTAKGSRAIADRIIELAKEEGIPLHEDSDLVAALMELDFQEQIPPHLYKAVAEILAFVYRLNKAHKAQSA